MTAAVLVGCGPTWPLRPENGASGGAPGIRGEMVPVLGKRTQGVWFGGQGQQQSRVVACSREQTLAPSASSMLMSSPSASAFSFLRAAPVWQKWLS